MSENQDSSMNRMLVEDSIRKIIQQDIFAKWQLESEDILEEISKSLGWSVLVTKDRQTGTIMINALALVQNPPISKEGILAVNQLLYPVLNRNTFLSCLNEKQINNKFGILFSQSLAVLSDLAENYDYYGIESISTMDRVQITVENVLTIALSRGKEGVTLDYMKTVQKIMEQISLTDGKREGNKGVFK